MAATFENELDLEEEDELLEEDVLKGDSDEDVESIDEQAEAILEEDEEDEEEDYDVGDIRAAIEEDEPLVGALEAFRTDRVLSRFERARIKAARLVALIHGAPPHPTVPEEVRRLGAEEITDYELDHRLIPLCIERTVETKRGIVYQEVLRLSDMDIVAPTQRLSWWLMESETKALLAAAPTQEPDTVEESDAKTDTTENLERVAPKKAAPRKKATKKVEEESEIKEESEPIAPKPKRAPAKKKNGDS